MYRYYKGISMQQADSCQAAVVEGLVWTCCLKKVWPWLQRYKQYSLLSGTKRRLSTLRTPQSGGQSLLSISEWSQSAVGPLAVWGLSHLVLWTLLWTQARNADLKCRSQAVVDLWYLYLLTYWLFDCLLMFIDICSITLGCDLCCIPSHLPRFPHPGWLRSHGVSNLLGRWEGAIPSTNQREMWLETPRPLQWLVKRLRGYTC